MTYMKYDAGRPKGADKDDCQVRALATARAIPYEEAWTLLYAIQGERKMCAFPLVEGLEDCDQRLGVIRAMKYPPTRGRARMNGAKFCIEHPKGRFILRMSHHTAAVVDGVLLDTWDSQHKCVYRAWEIEPK